MLDRRIPLLFALLGIAGVPWSALADEPLAERFSFRRASDFFATGATLATDTDGDGEVDTLLDEATVLVQDGDLAQGAFLQQALIYWGGSIAENANCEGGDSSVDDDVLVTVPGGSATMVTADVCYCAGGGNQQRDVQSCRADVTALVQGAGGGILGPWTVGSFQARINDGDTDTASFALVLVYGADGLPPRQVTIYDGLRTMRYDTISFQLDQLEVDDPPRGDLTWYVMEGDVGGSDDEMVTVRGLPGGRQAVLSDEVNPAQGPMNRTINTTWPAQTGVIGVDIDAFDLSEALTAGDTAVEVTYAADSDKWWIAFNIVGVQLFYSDFGDSSMSWSLSEDVGGDGAPSPGDELTYSIDLVNTGEGNASVSLSAVLPPQVASWQVLGVAGGVDASTEGQLLVQAVPVDAGASARVEFSARIGAAADGDVIAMQASFDVPGGGNGVLSAPDAVVGVGTGGSFGDDDDDAGRGGWTPGCGCATSGASSSGLGAPGSGSAWMLLPLLAWGRRRRR